MISALKDTGAKSHEPNVRPRQYALLIAVNRSINYFVKSAQLFTLALSNPSPWQLFTELSEGPKLLEIVGNIDLCLVLCYFEERKYYMK